MFNRLDKGGQLIGAALRAFWAYPQLIAPLLATWILYAPAVIYLRFYVSWDSLPTASVLGVVLAAAVYFSLIISASCLVLLELIEQIETDMRPALGSAVVEALRDTGRALPIAMLWASVWFVLMVIEMFMPSSDDGESEPDAEGIARTLGGWDSFSFSRAFIEAVSKGVRMLAFLVYPAIAWEDDSPMRALKKGLAVARAHRIEFASGFVLTELAAGIVFLPPGVIFLASSKFDISFPQWVWVATIIYCAFAWSFSVMLEQLFAAELYLWHLLWERECASASSLGHALPSIEAVPVPSLLDGVPGLERAALPDPAD